MRPAMKLQSAIRGVVYLATYNCPSSENPSLSNSSPCSRSISRPRLNPA